MANIVSVKRTEARAEARPATKLALAHFFTVVIEFPNGKRRSHLIVADDELGAWQTAVKRYGAQDDK